MFVSVIHFHATISSVPQDV